MPSAVVERTQTFAAMAMQTGGHGRARKRPLDRPLNEAARNVVVAFERQDTASTRTVVKLLDDTLARSRDPRVHPLVRLVLGVLVEHGLSPEAVWPTAERGLLAAIDQAIRYGNLALEAADTPSITDAITWGGRPFEEQHPREHAAWESLKSRALLATACLAFSPKLRAKAKRTCLQLVAACERLEDDVEPLKFLSQVLRLLPPQTMLAIHPEQRRGFRVEVADVLTNIELYVLLADAIVGDGTRGRIKGRRPSKEAIRVTKDRDFQPKSDPVVPLPFHLASWTALAPDGTLPPADEHAPRSWIAFEGVPMEIEAYRGERVLLFTRPMMPRELTAEGSIEPLVPRVTVQETLTAAEVDALLRAMGKAAMKTRAERPGVRIARSRSRAS